VSRALAALASLLLGTLLVVAGHGLLGTLVALQLALAGFEPARAGAILSAYFAGYTVGTLCVHRAIQGAGHIRAFTAFAATAAAVALAHGLSPPGWAWAFLRAASGFAMAAVFMGLESWLHVASDPGNRGRLIAVYQATLYTGLVAGQILLMTWPVEGVELFSLVALLMTLAVIPVALTRQTAPVFEARERPPLRPLVRRAPLAVAAAMAAGVLQGGAYAVGPLYAQAAGHSTRGVALFMGALVAGGLVVQLPLGRVSDRLDRRIVLLAMCLALAAVAGGGSLLPAAAPDRAVPLAFLLGGLVFSLYPIALAHAFDRVEREEGLGASALMMLAFGVGSVTGPLVSAGAMELLGTGGFFAVPAAVGLALAAVTARRIARVPPVPEAERAPFAAAPRTTPWVAELDPRTGPEDGSDEDPPAAGSVPLRS